MAPRIFSLENESKCILSKPLVSIHGPGDLQKVISEAVSTKFTVRQQAPLEITFRGEGYDFKMSNSRNKHVISGSFILSNQQGDILWSSNELEKFGISTKEASSGELPIRVC